MTWQCPAIDHGVTIFPNGKIGPCCQISADYLKPIESIRDPGVFGDLKTESPPSACRACIRDEDRGIPSYRKMFLKLATTAPGIQFLDIRNTNVCNLKCRYCGPHFSNQWATELKITPSIKTTSIESYRDVLITNSLHWVYFTGGEPLINPTHWELIEELVQTGHSSSVRLMYNTNLTTLKFKDKNIFDLWKKFKNVKVSVSIDSVDDEANYIRSGASWDTIKHNLSTLLNHTAISLTLQPVISVLNIWSIDKLLSYAEETNLPVEPIILYGPDYLSLDVIPDELKELALEKCNNIGQRLPASYVIEMKRLIENNINQELFPHTLQHILLLDKLRNENLFDLLPFKDLAINIFLKNNEYQ